MGALLTILQPLQWLNHVTGRVGRWLSVGAIAIMVAVILLQVFCRYVLNNALTGRSARALPPGIPDHVPSGLPVDR